MLKQMLIAVGVFGSGLSEASGQTDQKALYDLLSKPIEIERQSPVVEIPLTLKSGKIYLKATINDFSGEFIFDTGSPTILDQQFAEQFDYEIVGENTGQDANGKAVTMDIAIVDTLSIGGVTFQDVPVMIYDFGSVPLAECFIPNGVIGSEVLPGSAWRLNLADASLTIASDADDLPELEGTKSAPLTLFGYPFAPIVDYSIGKFSDKALFDTGNASEIALFEDIATDKSVRKKIAKETVRRGEGRHGTSAGGIGDILPLHRFELNAFQMGEYEFGSVQVQSRPIPPTLIGAGILHSHIVTLDYPGARLMLAENDVARPTRNHPEFALIVNEDKVEVSQLFDQSPAESTGLKLGDKVVEIDGKPLMTSTNAEQCTTSLWLANEFDGTLTETLKVERDGEFVEITF